MLKIFLRKVASLTLEEKILSGAVLLSLLGICMPWLDGQMLTADIQQSYSGFGFVTGFIGYTLFLLDVCILLLTIAPVTTGHTFIRKKYRHIVRLQCAGATVLLTLAALTVLLKITFEFPLMEIRFGIHVTLLGSIAGLFYAFLTWQQKNRTGVQELFHQAPEQEPPLVIAQEELQQENVHHASMEEYEEGEPEGFTRRI